jgi:hypothetical protein
MKNFTVFIIITKNYDIILYHSFNNINHLALSQVEGFHILSTVKLNDGIFLNNAGSQKKRSGIIVG